MVLERHIDGVFAASKPKEIDGAISAPLLPALVSFDIIHELPQ